MRKFPGFAFGFAIISTLVLSGTPATAKNVVIGGTHGAGEIQQKCEAAGGVFTGGLKGGGYGCGATSAGTTIICTNNGKCTGSVPAKTRPGNGIVNILRGTPPVSAKRGSTSGNKPVGGGIKPIESKQSSSHSKH
jgi:hypothetical protein